MAHQPTASESRLNNILECLTIAGDTLEVLAKSFETPFLEPMSNTVKSLLIALQTIRQNKSDCTQLLEQTYRLLCAIISLHMKPENGSDLSPSMLNDLGKFTDTLYKIHTFVEAQQDKSKIRHFFRQGEMSKLLRDCNVGLQEGLNLLKVEWFGVSYMPVLKMTQIHNINLLNEIADMQKFAQDRHQEVLELIDAWSDGITSDQGSLTNRVFSSAYNSSNSISMLPSEPKIFYGRESELSVLFNQVTQETPRIAILGAGGMGKTSLARAVLHHPTDELVIQIGAHLGLKPKKDLATMILHHFTTNPACLLILDNLETLWEPVEIRREIEEFLSLLTDVKDLALIITMRGTERPASVRWTRPFLPALKPLTQDAARQTFIDITDDSHDSDDIDKVLLLTDNMPLAINLMAHLVESEGCPKVLARWDKERTSVLSDGYDKRSNLELSISISLASPRIISVPHSQDLLSLLSLLPDGLSNLELLQSKLPIKGILHCKAVLLSTSLAYSDDQGQLKVLVPIREYMKKCYHPITSLIQPLLKYFWELLVHQYKYHGTVSASEMILRITSNFSNIQNLLLNRIQHQNPIAISTIYCAIYLNSFSRLAGHGATPLIDHIVHTQALPAELEVLVVTEIFSSWMEHPIHNSKALVDKAIKQLSHFDESDLKSEVKLRMGDPAAGRIYVSEAQRVAKISANLYLEAQALDIEAVCWQTLGDYKYAASLCTRARDLLVNCGMSGGDFDLYIMGTQAEIHALKSEYVEARNLHRQILDGVPIELVSHHHAFTLLNIAELDFLLSTPVEDVQRNIDATKSIFNSLGHLHYVMMCDATMGSLHLREQNLLSANLVFYKCLSLYWGNNMEMVNYCLERLGHRSLWGTTDWPSSWTIVYLVHASKSKQNLDVHKALQFLGDVFRAEGDQDTAISLLTVALGGFTHMDVHRSRAECMLQLGDISKQQGDIVTAVELWKTARLLLERSSQTKQIALIDERLSESITLEENKQSLATLLHIHAPTASPEELGNITTPMKDLGLTDENKDAALVLI
ncbi:hypothetical protein DFH09DRAFT_1446218 [Mycena vulgaris]|nr:hypothetical protein DFH09DRAFT_1446218 [Mycena vulgaris]